MVKCDLYKMYFDETDVMHDDVPITWKDFAELLGKLELKLKGLQ